MASKKYKITQKQQDSTLLELHPATDADIVAVEKVLVSIKVLQLMYKMH